MVVCCDCRVKYFLSNSFFLPLSFGLFLFFVYIFRLDREINLKKVAERGTSSDETGSEKKKSTLPDWSLSHQKEKNTKKSKKYFKKS